MFLLPFSFFIVTNAEKVLVANAEKVLVKCAPEETEMSINAKFRSIQPTPSILSYVEDNVHMITSYKPSYTLWLYV